MKFKLSSVFSLSFLLAFSGCSLVGIRTTEEANYRVEIEEDSFEVRRYEPLLVAETTAEGEWEESVDEGFRRLAGYIFGKNSKDQKVAMTAPVKLDKSEKEGVGESEKISMTAPVITEPSPDGWKMTFVLPAEYTMETVPKPLDDRVTLKEQPAKRIAAFRYSGFLSDDTFESYSKKLSEWLDENNYKAVSEPSLVGYDPPWTLPFLRRNEVWVEIE